MTIYSFVQVVYCELLNFELQILPNGDAWIPSLVKEIILVATNGKKALVVDEKLVSGSESNDRGKIFIPVILGVQVKIYLNQVLDRKSVV